MSATKILIIEDESAIREMLRFILIPHHYEILEAEDGVTAFNMAELHQPDLIILDWMLPKISGLDLVKQIRKSPNLTTIPIMMLTACAEEENKVCALNAGADDYVVKPFSPRELVARVQALLRRHSPKNVSEEIITINDLVIDLSCKEVRYQTQLIQLRPMEFHLLTFLIQNPERIYSRSQLLDSVWGHDAIIDERAIDATVKRLRQALKPYGVDHYIRTMRGMGYSFSRKDAS